MMNLILFVAWKSYKPIIIALVTVLLHFCTCAPSPSADSLKINFSSDHVMVNFNPPMPKNGEKIQEKELISMVKLVSTRFSRILVDPLTQDRNKNISAIANAVAKFNKFSRTTPTDPPTQLWVHIPYYPSETTDLNPLPRSSNSSFPYIRQVLDALEASNRIFNGSTQGIILSLDYFMHQNNQSVAHANVKEVKRIIRNETQFSYKLALMFPQRRVFINLTHYQTMAGILTGLDACCVMTFVNPTATDLESGVNATISKYRGILQQTMKEITGMYGTRNITAIFRTGYPDTSNNSKARNQYADLVQYWKNMSEGAVRTNSMVAFTEAFDSPERSSAASRSLGWWRRVEDTENDYVIFKEKAESIHKEHQVLAIKEPEGGTVRNFSYFLQDDQFDFRNNSHFSVLFNHHLAERDTTKIEMLLDKIAEKFGRISILEENLTIVDPLHFCNTLAGWNIQRNGSGRRAMDLSLYFTLPSKTDASDVLRENKINFVKSIVDTNKNTISSAQISFFRNYDPNKAVSYQIDVKFVSTRIGGNNTNEPNLTPKIGVELHLNACKKFDKVILPMLPHVKVVTLKYISKTKDLQAGIDNSITNHTKKFLECRNTIENDSTGKSRGIETVFSVGWQGINEDGKKNHEALVRFWREMGVWAEKENVSLVMTRAFDSLDESNKTEDGFGWWEISTNESKGFDFSEKRQILLKEMPPPDNSSQAEEATTTTESPIEASTSSENESSQSTTTGIPEEGTSSNQSSQAEVDGSRDEGMSDDEWWFLISWVAPTVCAIIIATILAVVIVCKLKRNPRELRKEEMTEFLEGKNKRGDNLGEELYINSRYNMEMHEVPLQNIAFDSVIESGKFSIFYKAVVANSVVAVKVPKKGCTKQYYKSMLMEAKIMANVGDHVNVLKFHGANSKDAKKGMFYIITEFCANGPLYSYLRTLRYNLEAVDDDPTKKLDNIYELYKFTYEIACGMHYLSEKDIIHGDLSAKNVLLDGGNICKISNYGLSYKLDENGEYVTRREDTFPWRWIAVETLKHKIVTGRSDVWSFGVTLWEIFSLGRIPYKSHIQEGFLEKLEKGLRLKRPKYATQDVYENMMQCWSRNPADRPRFEEQAEYFLLLMKEEQDTLDKNA